MSPQIKDEARLKRDRQEPGPGYYEHNKTMGKTAPNYGFGSSKRKDSRIGDKNVVTEIKYDPSSINKSNAPQYRFGSSKRAQAEGAKG